MKRTFLHSLSIACASAALLYASGIIPALIPAAVPTANKQGNSSKFQLAGTNSGILAAALCDDASGNTTTSGCAAGSLSGTTPSIGGGLLTAAACASDTATVTGAASGMSAIATPTTYPGDGIVWEAYVSSASTVTVKVCAIAALTPTTSVYNVRVIQ